MNFDGTEKDAKEFQLLKTGWYPTLIESAEDVESKSSGKPMTKITFKVAVSVGGNWTFRKVWGNYPWHVQQQKALLKLICQCVGINPRGEVSPAMLVDRKLEVYVNTEIGTGQYKDKNIVTNVRPKENGPVPVPDAETDHPQEDFAPF